MLQVKKLNVFLIVLIVLCTMMSFASAQTANLTVTHTAIPSSVVNGDTVTFMINVTNGGLINLTGLELFYQYDGTYFDFDTLTNETTPLFDTYNQTENTVEWLFDLSNGTTTSFLINFTAILAGTGVNNATVENATDYTVYTNATESVTINASPITSISVKKTLLNPGNPTVGDTAKFLINITNNGTTPITEAWLFDDYNNTFLVFTGETNCLPYYYNNTEGSIEYNLTECNGGVLAPSSSVEILVNFTTISAGTTSNSAEGYFEYEGVDPNASNTETVTIDAAGPPPASPALNVTLIYPTEGLEITSNEFEINFSVNATATCVPVANISFGPPQPSLPTGWDMIGMPANDISGEDSTFTMLPNGNYEWNVMCTLDSFDWYWASANKTFVMNGSMPDCFGIGDESTCNLDSDCYWESFADACFIDCTQFDLLEGGNISTCEGAFGGNICEWDPNGGWCDPAFGEMDKGFDGFSPCFDFDGNQSACDANSDTCVWFSQPNCPVGDWCYDVNGGTDHGFCDPNNFDWGQNYDCWNYDGNQTGCSAAEQTLGWACQWSADPWYFGPTGAGDKGWCNPAMFGSGGGDFGGFGGGTAGGCWDYGDQTNCEDATAGGLLCNWVQPPASGWCEEKGCWNYWDSTACGNAPTVEGCEWNSEFNYCYKEECWDLTSLASCEASSLDCNWYNNTYGGGGWCEENGCWNNDWTNLTTCEAQAGCKWKDPWCEEDGCWNQGSSDDCVNNSGLNCQWMTSSNGWCEQAWCWNYDGTNESACVNTTAAAGLDCQWDAGNNLCYEDFKKCNEYNNMFECFGTGWCFWDGVAGNGNCSEPNFGPSDFFNPGCWAFDKSASKCGNITTCTWTGSACTDNGADTNNGVQCADINNSAFCNAIPKLSSCCSWNGTSCEDAPYTTACQDNLQEPPVGAFFCDDYNAVGSKSTCDQIAGDPWYMPCTWDNSTSRCSFAFDNFFGGDAKGFEFKDLNKGSCVDAGGVWKSEQWKDNTGTTYWDEWCEMGFGFGSETCANSCWACEFQNNGSVWTSLNASRGACQQSAAGCTFFADPYAFNNYGWCDFDFAKSGNCEQNCWDCWDSSMCKDSNANCKWFTDPWNDNNGWCDGKNVKTCDNDCFQCWDSNNCGDSEAGCTWDSTYWFCKPEGNGDSGQESEVCFDGIDNDADTFIDCADPSCMFDNFCGGSAMFDSNCPSIQNNNTCDAQGCVWITDQWNNSWCDMNGSQCWLYDDNSGDCNAASGCQYQNMTSFGNKADNFFCEVNKTMIDSSSCWNYNNNTCDAQPGCTWTDDPWCQANPEADWCSGTPGWCDSEVFSCFQYDGDATNCNLQSHCQWMSDWFDPNSGWCDPICFSRDNNTCVDQVNLSGTLTSGVCELKTADQMGWCEPENMFKGCWDYSNNSTACDADTACAWINDPFTGGFCGDKFAQDMTSGMDPSPPLDLGSDDCAAGISNQTDICFLGIKDGPEKLGFGTEVFSMEETALCKYKFPNEPAFNGNKTTKFYWYVDFNGVNTGGCNATDDDSLVGFDMKIKYKAKELNGELVETKVVYKCLDGQWSPSKIKMNPWAEQMCFMVGGGVVTIKKDDLTKLKTLGLYNKSADMRIYATTADSTGDETNISDSIGPLWYTLNTADFKFENCDGFVDTDGDGLKPANDPDCTDFLKYGFVQLEKGTDCDDNKDNDGNGFTDCNDPGCAYDLNYCPEVTAGDDNKAPKIVWKDAEEFTNGAFIGIDTNEPTNATIAFHKVDNFCQNKTANFKSAWIFNDPKLENNFTKDDYSFWHDFPLDQIYFDENSVVYNFVINTTYYYKVKVCDKSGNCAQSACSNFTTALTEDEYFVGFDLPAPGDDITTPLGKMAVNFDFGGSTGTIDSNSGLKINESTGRDVNLSFSNPNATDAWEIDLVGSDFVSAQNINISDAFIANDTADGMMVGMNSDKWEEMAQKLGVDKIKITIPGGVTNSSNAIVRHCPDNATSLNDSRCINLSLSDINCEFTATETVCEIPTSIGFSVFGVVESAGGDIEDEPVTPSGGSGGGGGLPPTTVTTYTKTMSAIASGETKTVTIDQTTYSGVPFTGLEFTALNSLANVQLQVKKLASAPASTGSITHKAYNYISITETNVADSDITGTKVDFKVEKTWLTNNSVTKTNVALFRFADNVWSEQETSYSSEDADYVYYNSVTGGFSYFAIGQKSAEAVVEPTTTTEDTTEGLDDATGAAVTDTVEEVVETTTEETTEEEKAPASKGSKFALWTVIVLAIAALVLFLWKKEQNKVTTVKDKTEAYDVDKPHENKKSQLDIFIQEHFAKGHSEGTIKEALLKVGWDKADIESSLKKHKDRNN